MKKIFKVIFNQRKISLEIPVTHTAGQSSPPPKKVSQSKGQEDPHVEKLSLEPSHLSVIKERFLSLIL